MGEEGLRAEIERFRAENEALRQDQPHGSVVLKVSEKGGESVYVLGRFHVTPYKEHREKLLAMAYA